MAIDLEAIRRRLGELSGQKKGAKYWRPEVGDYVVRCLPWPDLDPSSPFLERWFYYIGENRGFYSPKQFNKPDPIGNFVNQLYSTGEPSDREMAKLLQAKMRVYIPVIVRGSETEGVQLWSFSKFIYQRLLSFYIDEDYGDILDLKNGFDLKVSVTRQQGKKFNDTTITPRPRPSAACSDPDTLDKWLKSIPSLDELYPIKSPEEIEKILNDWLNSLEGEGESTSEGTSRGAAIDEIDDLLNESPISSPDSNGDSPTSDDDLSDIGKSLDDAFEDLMS